MQDTSAIHSACRSRVRERWRKGIRVPIEYFEAGLHVLEDRCLLVEWNDAHGYPTLSAEQIGDSIYESHGIRLEVPQCEAVLDEIFVCSNALVSAANAESLADQMMRFFHSNDTSAVPCGEQLEVREEVRQKIESIQRAIGLQQIDQHECRPEHLAIGRAPGLLMTEKYDGVVVDTSPEGVTVAYQVGDDVVEQTYRKDQFDGGQLPELGAQLSVQVSVVKTTVDASKAAEELSQWDELDGHERKTLQDPIEF